MDGVHPAASQVSCGGASDVLKGRAAIQRGLQQTGEMG